MAALSAAEAAVGSDNAASSFVFTNVQKRRLLAFWADLKFERDK